MLMEMTLYMEMGLGERGKWGWGKGNGRSKGYNSIGLLPSMGVHISAAIGRTVEFMNTVRGTLVVFVIGGLKGSILFPILSLK